MKRTAASLCLALFMALSPVLAYAQPSSGQTPGEMAQNTSTQLPEGPDGFYEEYTQVEVAASKSFAQLAPTTRMSFAELVGDNGDYNSIKKFPAVGTYKLVVDLYHQVVIAYSKDRKGKYTVPVRYMVCTTGGPKTPTPVGTYRAKDARRRFSQFSTGEYAQYWMKVVGEIYIHSLLYSRKNANYYMPSSYRLLGSRGSHGCIRLLVPDARWVYYHMTPGSYIQIRTGSKNDKTTANIKKQLTRAALPKKTPNCKNVKSTDVWSIASLNAQLKKR